MLGAPVLLLLGATGLYWNIAEYIHETIEHAEEHHLPLDSPLYDTSLPFEDMLTTSRTSLPGFTPTYIVFAFEAGVDIMVFGYEEKTNLLYSDYSSGVIFDRLTGEQKSTWSIHEATTPAVIVDSFRELHFGTFGGLASRIIWAVTGALPLILAITGLTIWWVRKRKYKSKRHRRIA